MISVIMPVYNRENTILDAISSVINQSYTEWELIVVDDASTDHTRNCVEEICKTDARIKIINNDRMKGPSGARNSGICAAKGEYIAFLDSDDVWFTNHLTESAIALKNNDAKFVSALWDVNKWGKKYTVGSFGWFDMMFNNMANDLNIKRENKYWKFDDRLLMYILKTDFYCFHINTIVVKKDLLEQIGMFDERMRASEDLDLVYRLLMVTNLITINESHFQYNYGEDNVYAFIDRPRISVEELLSNREACERVADNVYYKIILNTKMHDWIRKKNLSNNVVASNGIGLKESVKTSKEIYEDEKMEDSNSTENIMEINDSSDIKTIVTKLEKDIYDRWRTYACLYSNISKVKKWNALIKSAGLYCKYGRKYENFIDVQSKYRKENMVID